MKKIKLYNKALLVTLLAVFASCNDDEDATSQRGIKSVISADIVNFSVVEGETVTIDLTTDLPNNDVMDYKLELVGGTGSYNDFTTTGTETTLDDGWGLIGYKFEFPAYASSASFDITTVFDFLPEGTETLVFKLSSMGNAKGLIAENSQTITINVTNATSDDVVAVVDWAQNSFNAHGNLVEGTYDDAAGDSHAFCDYDFDLEIYDAGFNVVADSYTSCPEQTGVSSTDPDGDYFIVPSFWTTVGPTAPAEEIKFKVKVTISKPGVWVYETNIDDVWNTTDGGAVQGFADAYQIAALLTKTGTTYVLEDANGDVVASGKSASFLSSMPRKKSK